VKDSVYRAPKGTRDLVWPDSERRRSFIDLFAEIVSSAGYAEIVLPMFEHVEVFQRLGDGTDVVRKEMYDFEDKGGRNIALRPEQTASIVRAYAEHRPSLPWKVWYAGPNFRYERAQKGRFRQFDQVGIEALGADDPYLDVEVIAIAWRFYEALGLKQVNLSLNSVGTLQDRIVYIEALSEYLEKQKGFLSTEAQETLSSNPLRVLDSKRAEDIEVVSQAPSILEHLSEEANNHFSKVEEGLKKLEIPYLVQPNLVRGLDYYVQTTFEFSTESIDAAQDAIGGGGRYDGLAAEMGAPATPGVGFALGLDRTLMACEAEKTFIGPEQLLQVYVIDTTGGENSLVITDQLRQNGFKVDRSFGDRSMKAQMKAADKSGAKIALIVGEDEVEKGVVTIRDLRGEEGQEEIASDSIIANLEKRL
jgi:histidyl-tRNA synthetase|tara:strand:- start:206 stop:1462 length:1257 start_codon:yes stop_codon:yes gene_type:complete